MANPEPIYPKLVPPADRSSRSVLHTLARRCRFSLCTLMRVIGGIAIVLGIVPGVARWQAANRSEHRGQIAISKLGGTFTMASADRLQRTGELSSWLYRRLKNRVAHVDLSLDTWVRSGDRRSPGPVTDQDLGVLEHFVNLRSLNLRGTNLTDDAVDPLAQIRSLEELDIRDTHISASGAAKLQSVLPHCRIVR